MTAKRVLLTGAAGYIGRHVGRACRARGWYVVGMDLVRGPDDVADSWLLHRSSAEAPLPAGAGVFDGLVHMAWPIDPKTYLVSAENTIALGASLALVRRVLDAGCRKVVIAGTCAEYEPRADGLMDEQTPVAPDTLYATCKHALHLVAASLCQQVEARLAWARIFHLYGPGENPARLLPSLARTLLAGETFVAGSGRHLRDYLRVEDIATGVATLLEHEAADGAYNICSGNGVPLGEIMQRFRACLDHDGGLQLGAKPDRAWEPEALVGDNARLRALGWLPRFTLDAGLADYAAILRAQIMA